jgi:DNA-directed RNA polymerase, mitochondrial
MKFKQQLELEREMIGMGVKRYTDGIINNREKQMEANSPYGVKMTSEFIEPIVEGIEEFLEKSAKTSGRKHRAASYLRGKDLSVIAFLTCKAVINCISRVKTLSSCALTISKAVEDQCRFVAFEEENPELWGTLIRDLERYSSFEKKRAVLIHSAGKANIHWNGWNKSDKLHLGMKLVEIFCNKTGAAEISIQWRNKKSISYLQATNETLNWIEEEVERKQVLAPFNLPMIVPPRPWTCPFDGGYYSPTIRRKLIKTTNNNYLEEMNNLAETTPDVYKALNTLQDTPWKINGRVRKVMDEMWELGWSVGKMPSRDALPLPPKPSDIKDNKVSRKVWSREASKIHVENARQNSKKIHQAKLLYIANKFVLEDEIYFPYQLDFRGRVYATPNFLNPQGCDLSKSLLLFSKGKRITSDRGINWLAIHGANVFGEDKLSFKDRIQWVKDNEEKILQTAREPFRIIEWWSHCDKPWQFLAFCFEWQSIKDNPNYESTLPVAQDGSCNGIQIFSSLLRDHIGGKAVNLIPSDTPEDIYKEVADVVIDKLENSSDIFAKQWLEFGISRKATKRPVMVLPYGGTRYSCRDFTEDYIKDMIEVGVVEPWGEDNRFKASIYLSNIIWASIGEVVIAARSAMGWLQEVAKIVSSEELPIIWTTPSGFVVMQNYIDLKRLRVKTQLGDSAIRGQSKSKNDRKNIFLSLVEPTSKLSKRRQGQGIAPNFVHSLDASVLILSVNKSHENGIKNFSMIHDSYGTLAEDSDILASSLRECFVEMFQDNLLEKFRDEVCAVLPPEKLAMIPDIPPLGELDLNGILESKYFFA